MNVSSKIINDNNYLGSFSIIPEDILIQIFNHTVSIDKNAFATLSYTCRKFCVLIAKNIDPAANQDQFFIKACELGCYVVVKAWIENNKKLNFSTKNNLPLRIVCKADGKKLGVPESYYNKILIILLEQSKRDSTIDPTTRKNFCIRKACKNGNAQIVQTLLADRRSNPSDNSDSLSDALKLACQNGHYEVVDILLQNTELVIPSDEEEIYQKHPEKYIELEEFPKKPSMNPLKNYEWALLAACKKNYVRIVSRFLRHPKVNPKIYQSAPLYVASRNRSVEVVQLLLEDGRADPAADSNLALRYAKSNKDERMIKLLNRSKQVLLSYFDYTMWVRDTHV